MQHDSLVYVNSTRSRFVLNDKDKDETDGEKKDVEKGYGVTYKEIRGERYYRRKNYTTTWGPEKFKKKQHPLAIMVNLYWCQHVHLYILHRWRASV